MPSTFPGLLSTFFSQPSILAASALIASAAAARLSFAGAAAAAAAAAPLPPPAALPAEAALCLAAVALWSASEWFIHRHLLHPSLDDDGGQGSGGGGSRKLDPVREALRRTHAEHHARPYVHVSVDGAPLVIGFMVATGLLWLGAFWAAGALSGAASPSLSAAAAADASSSSSWPAALISPNPLFWSALTAYWLAGLFYEFIHFAAHTKFVPRGRSWPARYLRAVRRHHLLHHCRSEAHWLAFTVPQIDLLFGTLPEAGNLPPTTAMAREAARSWRRPGGPWLPAEGGGGSGGGGA